jgi:protein-tyrosine phosphatase
VQQRRNLKLAGARNFRDLGGYPARGNRSIRWGRLYRSNHLGHLTEDDAEILRGLGLKRVFDLRGVEERLAAPCRIEEFEVHSLPIEPVIVPALKARLDTRKQLSPADAVEIMRNSYRNYVRYHTRAFRALFAHLIADSAPAVLHCSAGKDRTGFASALILSALGVPNHLVVEDYLLTNDLWTMDRSATGSDLPAEIRDVLAVADESFLAAAFATIEADHRGLESYFEDGLGLGPKERARLEDLYLDP